jgi:hypothetical protein
MIQCLSNERIRRRTIYFGFTKPTGILIYNENRDRNQLWKICEQGIRGYLLTRWAKRLIRISIYYSSKELEVDISNLTLQSEEVSEVKWIHFTELQTRWLNSDPEYVPVDLRKSPYKQFFEILEQKYNSK